MYLLHLFNSKVTFNMIAGFLILLAVFITDLCTPLGIAVGVLYLFSIVLIIHERRNVILFFGILAAVLTLIKLFIFADSSTTIIPYLNRFITVVAIGVTTILSMRHRKVLDEANKERRIYIGELRSMLSLTSHRVRKPLSTCMGLMNIIDKNNNMSKEELLKLIGHLKLNAQELDDFTHELTKLLATSENQHRVIEGAA